MTEDKRLKQLRELGLTISYYGGLKQDPYQQYRSTKYQNIHISGQSSGYC